jgi:hypothetical protein
MGRAIVYVEVDQNYCGLTYGVAPCTASIPTTGAAKCYNTIKTCQAPSAFSSAPVTLRFGLDVDYLPRDIDCIPSITSWSVSPAIISLGEDLGLRAEVRVSFKDHPWSDTGPGGDKYLADRAYNPFTQGTFWGKWRARVQFLRGQAFRIIIGQEGQALADMETRHFIVESFDGPTPDGVFTIVAKDPLKLLDGDRAQAPTPNNGFLISDITAIATSFTLSPSGIGNAEYPASGYINIGGGEIVAFTRSNDTVTITARGQLGTTAQAHKAQDRAQVVLYYSGDDPAEIIYDLMVNYAGVDPDYINIADWTAETAAYLRRVFSAIIADSTGVKKLITELVQQAALSVWWDEVAQKIRLRVLRPIETNVDLIGPDVIQAGSFRTIEQPDKRVSQVWVYYGQRNPLQQLEDLDNYRSLSVSIDTEAETNYGSPAIRKIFSRWIASGGRTVATRIGDIYLGRYKDPPRRFNFSLLRGARSVQAGQGYRVTWWNIQDATGTQTNAPIEITRLSPGVAEFTIEAEEQLFEILDPEDLENRVITFDADIVDVNLRTAHDSLFPTPTTPGPGETLTVTCLIETGVTIGASTAATPAFNIGTWPAGITIRVINKGRIQGAGGAGGAAGKNGSTLGSPGSQGGLALYARASFTMDNSFGQIWAGGGGGSGGTIKAADKIAGGGGGGAGFFGGAGGATGNGSDNAGFAGTKETGGAGGASGTSQAQSGGRGGDPGQAGESTGGGSFFETIPGGQPGNAIDGDTYITFADLVDDDIISNGIGNIIGARIN